jgi:hypothetical protein
MKRALITLLFLSAATSAVSAEGPSAQWKASSLSLFELVQAGYNIVAVTNDASSGQMFFVQKNGSAYKCTEIHVDDFNSKKFATSIRCWELVKPYAATLPR